MLHQSQSTAEKIMPHGEARDQQATKATLEHARDDLVQCAAPTGTIDAAAPAADERMAHQTAAVAALKAMSAFPARPQPVAGETVRQAAEVRNGDGAMVFEYDCPLMNQRMQYLPDPYGHVTREYIALFSMAQDSLHATVAPTRGMNARPFGRRIGTPAIASCWAASDSASLNRGVS
jgi:hypothetical protein